MAKVEEEGGQLFLSFFSRAPPTRQSDSHDGKIPDVELHSVPEKKGGMTTLKEGVVEEGGKEKKRAWSNRSSSFPRRSVEALLTTGWEKLFRFERV